MKVPLLARQIAVVLDELVQLPFPVLVCGTHAHADAIDQLRPGGFLHQWRDMERGAGHLRVVACHRAPQHASVDLAGGKIINHRFRRIVEARVDHQLIGLCTTHQARQRHVGCGRCAGDDADTLALQLRILEYIDVLKPAARLRDQRIGCAVVGIGALHEVVALRKAHDDVAAMRTQRHAHEARRLREEDVVELLLQLLRKKLRELVLETLPLLVGERQIARVGADAQHLGIHELEREIARVTGLRDSAIAKGAGRDHDPK